MVFKYGKYPNKETIVNSVQCTFFRNVRKCYKQVARHVRKCYKHRMRGNVINTECAECAEML